MSRRTIAVLAVVAVIAGGLFVWSSVFRVTPEEIIADIVPTSEVMVLEVTSEAQWIYSDEPWIIVDFITVAATEHDMEIGTREDARFFGPWWINFIGIDPADNGPTHYTPFELSDAQVELLIDAEVGDCVVLTYDHYDVTGTSLDNDEGRSGYSRVLSDIRLVRDVSCGEIEIP